MGVCDSKTETRRVNKPIYSTYPKGEIRYVDKKVQESFKGQVSGGKGRVELKFTIKNTGHFDLNDSSLQIGITTTNINGNYENLGYTERALIQKGSLTTFATSFVIDYFFEKHQYLKLSVYTGNNVLASVNTTLGKIMGSKAQSFEFIIDSCSIIASAKIVDDENINTLINLKFNYTANQNGIYFIIISSLFTGIQKVVKSAEQYGQNVQIVINNLRLYDICSNNRDQEFLIEIYEEKFSTLIGSLKTSLSRIHTDKGYMFDPIMNQFIPNQNGNLQINYNIEKVMKFLEYLEKGLQISVMCAIDYTGSNGVYTLANSKHYIASPEPNQYEQAIRSCGSVVAYYDYDQYFPVFGFGGIIPSSGIVNHCFNVSLNADPNVFGIDGIINSYKRSLEVIRLDGPTLFSPLIRNVTKAVTSFLGNNITASN